MMALIPLLLATGPGSEIQSPLVMVVIGGLFSSTALILVVDAPGLVGSRSGLLAGFSLIRSSALASASLSSGARGDYSLSPCMCSWKECRLI